MINRRLFIASAASLGAASLPLALSRNAYAAEDTVEIEVMHAMPGQDAYFNQVAEAFMKRHPEIKVKFRASPADYASGHQAVLRGAITRSLPDVYHSAWIYFKEAVTQLDKRRAIVDLTPLVAKEGKAWVEANYYPSMLGLGAVNGKQYALPFAASTPVHFFNADLVKAAGGDSEHFPTDWNELIALAGCIKALGNDLSGMAFDIHSWPDDWLWQAVVMERGGSLMAPDGKHCGFNNSIGLDALKFCARVMKEGGMTMRDFDQSRQAFVAGKVGFIMASPNSARAFNDLIGTRFKLGCQIYPRADKAKGRVPTGGNGAVILAKDEKKIAAAWEYIKFACGPEGQKIAVLGSGYMPTNKLAEAPEYLGDFYKKNPNWYTPVKQAPYAAAWQGYTGTNGVKIWYTQRDIIGRVMRGELTPENALPILVKATEALF